MPSADRTHHLRELVSKAGPSRMKHRSTRGVKQENGKDRNSPDALLEKEYLKEAYAIVSRESEPYELLLTTKDS